MQAATTACEADPAPNTAKRETWSRNPWIASFGASAGNLLIVLAALTRWSIHPDDDHVVTVTHDEALDNLLDTPISASRLTCMPAPPPSR